MAVVNFCNYTLWYSHYTRSQFHCKYFIFDHTGELACHPAQCDGGGPDGHLPTVVEDEPVSDVLVLRVLGLPQGVLDGEVLNVLLQGVV